MSRFQFVADHRDAFEVKRLCQVLAIARSSFYQWQAAAPARAARAAADEALAARIRVVHDADRACGAPRITAELNDGAGVDERVNHKRVARVMRERAIAGIRLRRRVRTTVPDPDAQVVPDLLDRDFTASEPNRKYVGDITYLPCGDGTFLYLATVIDCFSRRLVGWSIADHMRTDLVTDALEAAAATRGTLAGAIITPTTAGSTSPRTGWPCVDASACDVRWARSAPARTTRWPSRSTPPSNARPSPARTAGPTPPPPAEKSSPGSPATTPAADTRPADTAARSPTRTPTTQLR